MTWLVGSSTWSSIVNDICKLACAEITDSLGHAPTTGERWVRDIDTGHNVLRMPAAHDVDLAAGHAPAMRAGYWTLLGPTASRSVCRQSAPAAGPLGAGVGSFGRMWVRVNIWVPNTVAGDYSTATLQINIYDVDVPTFTGTYTMVPNAAGVVTIPNVWGFGSAQMTVSDPSGFLQAGATWARGFTSTYLWGVDAWPLHAWASGAWAFSTAPPGVAGTDYDIISQISPTYPSQTPALDGGWFSGLGCKTATAANGSRYVFSACPTAQLKVALQNNAGAPGYIDLFAFGPGVDTVNGNAVRIAAGNQITGWLRLAQTPSSVTGAMTVQYWMSVTATGIVVVLNSDPAYTGGMTDGYFGLFTPGSAYDTANDKFQNFVSAGISVWLAGNASMAATNGLNGAPYLAQYQRQDGSHGARDWQTYWMRADDGAQFGASTLYFVDYELSPYDGPVDSVKPGFDGNWWMYGTRLTESSALAIERGALNDRFWHLPGIGWGNGDELTDTVTGTKYFLVMPDAPGLPGRANQGTGIWHGGTAIAEL